MKQMKIEKAEYKNMSVEDLQDKLKELEKNLYLIKLEKAYNNLQNTSLLWKNRNLIAYLHTLISQKKKVDYGTTASK